MADAPSPDDRENSLATENENLQATPDRAPPRPATEPGGSRGSQDSAKTATDPGSGAGQDQPPAPNRGPHQPT